MDNTNTITTPKNIQTLDLVYVAIGTALIAICSWISIPTAIPFTLQTFAVFVLMLLLGGKRGTLSVLCYILLGAIGLPVFAGFSGGLGIILGNTGGYIIGFIAMGLIYVLFEKILGDKLIPNIISLILGLAACYTIGTLWFMFVYTKNTGTIGLASVLTWCVIPFIIPDLIKMALAFVIAKRVKPIIISK